jgi:hypothetical protein
MPFLIMAALGTATIYKGISPTDKYKKLKKIPDGKCGKNRELTQMYSLSRLDPNVKKLWMYKPFFNENNDNKYELASATNEVYFGQLAVGLFGKTRAAKTKFNPELRGVISRILGDDDSNVMDLLDFCNASGSLAQETQKTLLATIIYSLIIEDRDLNLENLIIKSSKNAKDSVVYGIDHEFAGSIITPHRTMLSEIIIKLDKNPREIIHLLFDEKFNWNSFYRDDNLSNCELEEYSRRLLGTITHEEFINALQHIIEALAFDDFKICYEAKDKIYKALYQNRHIYSVVEIEETVVPRIDAAIATVKNNVVTVREFLDSKNVRSTLKNICKKL